jgi:hypothetical protein
MGATLTERDKKLLYILVFVIIIFIFGWCLIRPLYKHTVEDQENIEIAASLKASNQTKVMNVGAATALTGKFREELAESYEIYYDYMDSSEIDKLVTSYILRKGLLARDLTITMPSGYISESPYAYSDIRVVSSSSSISTSEETIDNLMGTSTTTTNTDSNDEEINSSEYYKDAVEGLINSQDTQEMALIQSATDAYMNGMRYSSGTAGSGILCVRLSIVVEGDKTEEQAIIDDLTHNPSVRVTSFNWVKLDPVTFLLEDGSILVVDSEVSQLHLSVNLYMKDMVAEEQ